MLHRQTHVISWCERGDDSPDCFITPPLTVVCVRSRLCAFCVFVLLSCLYLWTVRSELATWYKVIYFGFGCALCVCLHAPFETLTPAVEYTMSMGCVGIARAKFTINHRDEWKTGLRSDLLCVCAHTCVPWFIYCGVTCRLSQMPLSERSSLCSTRAVSAIFLLATKTDCSFKQNKATENEIFICFRSSVVPCQAVHSSRPKWVIFLCTYSKADTPVYNRIVVYSWSGCVTCVSEGKSLKDEDVLQHLPVGTTATFYFRDLGAQISWVTVS